MCPVSHSGNNPGRVKRVVSYKRKTRHLVTARKKPQGSGRTHDAAKKDNKRQEMFDTDPQVLMPNGSQVTGRTAFQHDEYLKLAEVRNKSHPMSLSIIRNHCSFVRYFNFYFFQLTRDHSTITEVLLGRNLRLKVALSLWKRHFGELITYFQRYYTELH